MTRYSIRPVYWAHEVIHLLPVGRQTQGLLIDITKITNHSWYEAQTKTKIKTKTKKVIDIHALLEECERVSYSCIPLDLPTNGQIFAFFILLVYPGF